jgi:hypothetical protein
MAEWSPNNRACKTTWFTLFVLNQHQEAFPDAGELKMKDLTFYSRTADADLRKTMARDLAIAMDNNFRLIRGADFEKSVQPGAAIKDMVDVLLDEDKTMTELAAVNDDNYRFLGEKSDEI